MNQLQTASSCVKIVGDIGKSSCEYGREQKFRQTPDQLSREHPLCLSKKWTGDGTWRTIRKPRTNYASIMFANEMFANIYAALKANKFWFMTSCLLTIHVQFTYGLQIPSTFTNIWFANYTQIICNWFGS